MKKNITKTLIAALVLHGGRGGAGGRSSHRQANLPQDGGWNNSGGLSKITFTFDLGKSTLL